MESASDDDHRGEKLSPCIIYSVSSNLIYIYIYIYLYMPLKPASRLRKNNPNKVLNAVLINIEKLI